VIAVAAGAKIQGVVDAINGAGIDATAFAIDDGQGSVRLAVVGDKTGADQALTIGNDFGLTLTVTQTAQNARIVLDPDSALPLPIESSSNSFENVIQGLTIEARVATAAAERVTVNIRSDADAVKESLTGLVDAYNAIADVIRTQNTIDPTTNRGGPLLGDSTMVGLGQRLSSAFARIYGTGSVTNTSQIGIELGRDGRLSLNEAELADALESDFEGVATFFAGVGGFADQLRELTDSFVDPLDNRGMLLARISGTTERIANLKDSIADAEERLDTFESNLVQQFAALERTLSQFQEQSNFLASFLAAGQSR
jgi:flagellar hook-associated protein 2